MIEMLVQGWFGRWKVYELGHADGDEHWLATFRERYHAEAFLNRFAPKSAPAATDR